MTVPEGAELIGPVFTRLDEDEEPIDQIGYLISENPLVAASSFADQGAAPEGDGEGNLCKQDVYDGPHEGGGIETRTEPYEGDLIDGALEIRCDLGIQDQEPVEQLGELYQPATGVFVQLWKDLTIPSATGQGIVSWSSTRVEVPTSLPVAPPVVGGPSRVPSDVDYLPDLEIVPGSFLAGPAFPGSGTGGYVSVIGVSGDPDAVFDGYVAQDDDKPYFEADTVVDGLRIRTYRSAEAGGIWLDITLNEIDGNAWILVSAAND